MPKGFDDQGPYNWRCLWESNKNSCPQAARAWLLRLSSSPPSLRTLSISPFTSDLFEAVAMSSNLMIQLLEDQFFHWRQDIDKKQEKQARQLKDL